jgi:hypothetical protein
MNDNTIPTSQPALEVILKEMSEYITLERFHSRTEIVGEQLIHKLCATKGVSVSSPYSDPTMPFKLFPHVFKDGSRFLLTVVRLASSSEKDPATGKPDAEKVSMIMELCDDCVTALFRSHEVAVKFLQTEDRSVLNSFFEVGDDLESWDSATLPELAEMAKRDPDHEIRKLLVELSDQAHLTADIDESFGRSPERSAACQRYEEISTKLIHKIVKAAFSKEPDIDEYEVFVPYRFADIIYLATVVSARYSVDEPYGRLGIVIKNWDYTYPGASDGFTILLSGGSEVDRFVATGDISAMRKTCKARDDRNEQWKKKLLNEMEGGLAS